MEIADVWNIKFSAPYRRKCAWCEKEAKVFWSYDGRYICKNCVDDAVAEKEAEAQAERQLTEEQE